MHSDGPIRQKKCTNGEEKLGSILTDEAKTLSLTSEAVMEKKTCSEQNNF